MALGNAVLPAWALLAWPEPLRKEGLPGAGLSRGAAGTPVSQRPTGGLSPAAALVAALEVLADWGLDWLKGLTCHSEWAAGLSSRWTRPLSPLHNPNGCLGPECCL